MDIKTEKYSLLQKYNMHQTAYASWLRISTIHLHNKQLMPLIMQLCRLNNIRWIVEENKQG